MTSRITTAGRRMNSIIRIMTTIVLESCTPDGLESCMPDVSEVLRTADGQTAAGALRSEGALAACSIRCSAGSGIILGREARRPRLCGNPQGCRYPTPTPVPKSAARPAGPAAECRCALVKSLRRQPRRNCVRCRQENHQRGGDPWSDPWKCRQMSRSARRSLPRNGRRTKRSSGF